MANVSTERLEQRLTELEVRLTFMDDALNALIEADADQSTRLAALERIIADLRSELAGLRGGPGSDPHNEPPPPHY